jgi:hypothetical protein
MSANLLFIYTSSFLFKVNSREASSGSLGGVISSARILFLVSLSS